MFKQPLEALAQNLDGRGIPYMVVGGQAVLLYCEPRLTRDILPYLRRWLNEFQESLGRPFTEDFERLRAGTVSPATS